MGDILVASPEAVDAYKTYLYAQGHVTLANQILPGELIPTFPLEKHIDTTISSITIMKEFGLTYGAEEAKLAGLEKLLAGVAGKRTPSKEEVALQVKKAELAKKKALAELNALKAANAATSKKKAAVEKAKDLAAKLAESKGKSDADLAMDKAKAKAKVIASVLIGQYEKYENISIPEPKDPVKTIGSGYYDKVILDKLKANTPLGNYAKQKGTYLIPGAMLPVKKPKETVATLNVGRAKLEQEFIMRVGMVSNLNVLIEQTEEAGLARFTVRLRCKKCASLRVLNDSAFLSGVTELTDDVEQFCKSHRHEAPQPVAEIPVVGRVFREDD